jgi:hypothetical protein
MPRFNATPYVVVGGVTVAVLAGLFLWRRARAGGPVPAEIALADLIATGHLILVSQFNPDTQLFEAFVPGLPGNTLTAIRPNWLIHITMSVTHTIISSGFSYIVPANVPTNVLTGDTVSITVLS